ncbi:GntR family transcriptional regulator [Paraburkholderia sediminicola]|jgi:DNA-binding GntR family transcriptional regulator|uniref:GntR family transcriptional regulator n=1 Tax=Paraburkholderia TaxID=1822464 RepID=UPI0038B8B6D3
MERKVRKIERLPAARTRSESLRLRLEGDILERRLVPGTKLDEAELAEQFGMSRTPVREALKSLLASGLVENRPHQGTFVASLSERAFAEMIETMCFMEAACAQLAARRSNAEDFERICAARDECEKAALAEKPKAFYDANARFHEAIYEASHNSFLAEQTRSIRQRLSPYGRQITFHAGSMQRSVKEHQALVDAILQMNEKVACDTMTRHLESLKDSISTMISGLGG